MTANEKLADDLGQLIFRIETNLSFAANHTYDSDKAKLKSAIKDCQTDTEKLKDIKSRILLGNQQMVEKVIESFLDKNRIL